VKTQRWEAQFDRWLAPFLAAWGHKTRRKWAPVYLRGLLLPGERKSVTALAERVAVGDGPQLHHFVAESPWDPEPIEEVLLDKVSALVGGRGSHLIVDDVALPKKGNESVGVAHQYCGALGKQSNCQCLVSITWARDDVPLPVALRLYLPKEWADSPQRRRKGQVPKAVRFRQKWRIALDEVTRLRDLEYEFDDVLADAGYGMCAEFRAGLDAMGLRWTVGILSTQNVYSVDVDLDDKPARLGRPRKYPRILETPQSARDAIEALGEDAFRTVTWRQGTKGPLRAEFAAIRIRVADGPRQSRGVHPPGKEAWLVCERRTNQKKYYLSNQPRNTPLKRLASLIKARWSCEQVHQQLKEELGLDHFEGRSWRGLHRHALLTMLAFTFLQHLRLAENKS
jgi:SRSO17 transposase